MTGGTAPQTTQRGREKTTVPARRHSPSSGLVNVRAAQFPVADSLRAMSREPWLVRAAARRPDRVAVEAFGERATYAELLERARKAAEGLENGDRGGQ